MMKFNTSEPITGQLLINDIEPIATPRPRFRRIGKGVQTYYKTEYKDYLQEIRNEFQKEYARKEGDPLIKKDDYFNRMYISFIMPRPKYHYGTGKNAGKIKEKYKDVQHNTKPDIDNLSKAILDALTGLLYEDDTQVTTLQISKTYTNSGIIPIQQDPEKPGICIQWMYKEGKENDK